jgi:hypothetical protein
MTTRRKYILTGITAVLMCIAVIFFSKSSHKGQVYLQTQTFKTADGWGYSIMAGNKVFIRQENIPAIAGKHSFTSEAEAARVGDLVRQRIGANQQPAITIQDLEKLGIKY